MIEPIEVNGMMVTEINGNWIVREEPGNIYTVQLADVRDGKRTWLWECTCDAGQKGNLCKHIIAVVEYERINGN